MRKKLAVWLPLAQGLSKDELENMLSKHFEDCVKNQIPIILDFFPEGPDLYQNNFWSIIEKTACEFNIPVSEIQIELSDYNADYPCKVFKAHPYWLNCIHESANLFQTDFVDKCENLFGHFIARPSWDRVIIHEIVKNNGNSLYSFWHGKDKPHSYEKTISNLQKYYPQDFEKYKRLLDNFPSSNLSIKKPLYKDFVTFPRYLLPLKPCYQKIFVDIVSETVVSGKSCFITEKTIRPMIFKTPFIIVGGKGFLTVLKKLGFQTFSNWWDEDYDNYSGPSRIEKIKQVMNFISNQKNINSIKQQMQNVIEHNYNHVVTLGWRKYFDKI